MENISTDTNPGSEPIAQNVLQQEDVFVIPRTTFNYVVIAATFLAVGIALGAILFGSRGDAITRSELTTVVKEAVDEALKNTTVTQEREQLDPNETYEVLFDADDPAIGPEDALVTVIEFSDFRCGYCGRFAAETLPALLQNYGNKVRFVYRDYPQFGALSVQAALAAQCANDQGQFWMMHNLLFANVPAISQEATALDTINQFATQIGLDIPSFNSCMEAQAHLEEIRVDFQDGQKYGPIGTPTFFVNGKPVIGAQPYEVFAKAIDDALAAAESAG